jgi:hypothetical protein
MEKYMKYFLALVLFFVLTSTASADIYVGFGLGRANYEGDPVKSTVFEYHIGKRINDYVAFEFGFLETSQKDSDDEDGYEFRSSFEGTSMAITLMLEPAEKFEAYLQLGAYTWENSITEREFGSTYSEKVDNQDLFYGAGLRYEVGSGVYAGVEHSAYESYGHDFFSVNRFVFDFEF